MGMVTGGKEFIVCIWGNGVPKSAQTGTGSQGCGQDRGHSPAQPRSGGQQGAARMAIQGCVISAPALSLCPQAWLLLYLEGAWGPLL